MYGLRISTVECVRRIRLAKARFMFLTAAK